jgi:nitrile hydratase beta subunit
MNGVHDMGGMDGFGKVEPEADEPVFHAQWEGRVIAMTRAMAAADAWNINVLRDARERQPAAFYLTASYYQSWAKRLEMLVLSRGLATPDEIVAGHSVHPAKPLQRGTLKLGDVRAALKRKTYSRSPPSPAVFKIGNRVRAKNMHPTTHTRLPRYARGRLGVIERVHGCHVFPDSSALGDGDNPQWLYTVVFEGRELWGERLILA